MTNQWGRDSDFRSGGGRSGAATVIVILAAFALGGAGGYAASSLLQADAIVAGNAERAQTAELDQALAELRDELSAARAAEASSAAEVESLKADIARMAGDMDAMAEKLAGANRPAAVPAETNGAADALRRERDALAAENEAFKAGLEALEAERQALKQQAETDRQMLQDELERLQGELVPELTSERDRLKGQTATLLADKAALEARIETASKVQAADAERIVELEALLKTRAEELEAARRATETLGNEAKAAMNADRVKEAGAQAVQPPAEAGVQDAASVPDPRDPDAVARALRAAPGLQTLSEADRQQLTERLVRGECVTSALESLFDRVPILTLRNLIRDLNSDC